MKTIEEIIKNRRLPKLEAQLTLGYCVMAGLTDEQKLNQRKIHNRQILNNCINSLNRSNKVAVDEKSYINIVQDVNDIEDEHDIYLVSTTFGLRYYSLHLETGISPVMKLTKMLDSRTNSIETGFLFDGKHKQHHLHYTGLLLQFPAHKYIKTSTYDEISKQYTGYGEII